MADAQLSEIPVSPAAALPSLARAILADQAQAAPDLSGAVVILPNLHAAPALARSLGQTAGRPLLLPRITTLGGWCASVQAPVARVADAMREAALFDALRSRNWFEAPDLWPLAAEIAVLLDELTRYSVRLPESQAAFLQQIEAAYQARAGEPMQFEARLVYELWRAFAQPADISGKGEADAAGIYHLQLGRIAAQASAPLYAIGLAALTPAERDFFVRYAQRAPVRLYRVDATTEEASLAEKLYATAWPQTEVETGELRGRAHSFAVQCPASPVSERIALFGANSLEQEARAVETQVRRWLVEGCKSIAVVALDRLVARRVRALLERAQVMVQDETGWIFSTTSASTVIMRWLETLSGNFYHQDLLDLLKSPFIFSDWPERREAVYRFERVIRAESVVAGLDRYAGAAQADEDGALALELIERLRAAERIFHRDGRRRIHDWMSLLFDSLRALGVDQGLRNDAAGLQLCELLELRARELAGSTTTFSYREWQQWLNRQLESAEFRDTGISSPVTFTHLSSTRLRGFDAAALVGCDATHLPGVAADTMFFNQSVRVQLGLPGIEQQHAQVRDDLIGLLSRCAKVLVSWQQLRNGEPNLPSPLIERLEVFHRLGWNQGLHERFLAALLPQAELAPPLPPGQSQAPPLPELSARPAPVLRADRVPDRISASGYNSLVACPYQFYARYALGLSEPDEVREALEKRDYGEYVHRILREFHGRFARVSDTPREELERALREISNRVFRAATEADYLSHAWAIRWRTLIPQYLDWQLAREQDGWRFRAGELKREIVIELPGGARLRLEGRLDRVDERATESGKRNAVLDYKTRNAKLLKEALGSPGEDVQLPVYAALLAEPAECAFYLSLDRDTVEEVPIAEDVAGQAQAAIERLREIFSGLHDGAPAPAQGIDAVCAWCEMQGLCRREYWA